MKPTPAHPSPQHSACTTALPGGRTAPHPVSTCTTALSGGRTGARTALDGPKGPSYQSAASNKPNAFPKTVVERR
ncbi:hypothetical protein Mal15_62370 [Stieleria maiorica]|uniref:Uncharacterized protein n=1 Tax=Stieleria maiorica TaxID=2795974 RepID=A0A5B9MMB7_9BACT|nr:hypothetical protein Mal15_62370 [Stieleria maiorica]